MLCSIIMAIITDTDDYYNFSSILPHIMRFLKHVLYNIYFSMPQKYLAQCLALSTWPINIYWGGKWPSRDFPVTFQLVSVKCPK